MLFYGVLWYTNDCLLSTVHTYTRTHARVFSCTDKGCRPQKKNIGHKRIFLCDIYVKCLNVKKRKAQKEKDNTMDKEREEIREKVRKEKKV